MTQDSMDRTGALIDRRRITKRVNSRLLTPGTRFLRSVGLHWRCSAEEFEREEFMSEIAPPKPPYYAVIFSSHRTDGDNGYAEMAERMAELLPRSKSRPGRPETSPLPHCRGFSGQSHFVMTWRYYRILPFGMAGL